MSWGTVGEDEPPAGGVAVSVEAEAEQAPELDAVAEVAAAEPDAFAELPLDLIPDEPTATELVSTAVDESAATAVAPAAIASDERSVMAKYGGRLSRETLIYAIGMFMVFPLGFVQVAVFTRIMSPATYGELGVLMVFAGFATLVMNTGSLQGTFMWTFGSSGDADGADISVDFDDDSAAGAENKRRALGTGLVMTLAICALVSVPLIAFSSQVSVVVLGNSSGGELVEWAVLSAVFGAIWRLTVTALRHERRPVLYSIGQILRPVAVVGIAAPLVIAGYGVRGALLGTTLGSVIGVLYCFAVDYKSYTICFDREDAWKMAKLGAAFIFIVIGLFGVHDMDLYMVSWFTTPSQTGIYRLASRIATMPSYFVSAFMFAQSSLERSMLFHATYERSGRSKTKSTLLSYYLFCGFGLVLFLGVTANILVRIAAPSYAPAAKLIPVLGFAYACYGAYVVIIRAAQVPHRRLAYAGSALGAAAIFVVSAIFLIPALGAYGAPIAEMIGLLSSSLFLLWLMRYTGEPLGIQIWRILRSAPAVGICYVLGTQVAPAIGGHLQYVVGLFSLLLYPVLLVAFGAIPVRHLGPLRTIGKALLPRRRRSPLLDRLGELPPRRRVILEELVKDRRSPGAVARAHHVSVEEVATRLCRALKQLVGAGAPGDQDALLGEYLLALESPADHDSHARVLAQEGVDPLDIHELDAAMVELQRTPRRAWKAVT